MKLLRAKLKLLRAKMKLLCTKVKLLRAKIEILCANKLRNFKLFIRRPLDKKDSRGAGRPDRNSLTGKSTVNNLYEVAMFTGP